MNGIRLQVHDPAREDTPHPYVSIPQLLLGQVVASPCLDEQSRRSTAPRPTADIGNAARPVHQFRL